MQKHHFKLEVILLILLVMSYGLLVTSCFAEGQSQQAQEESISITTYYPSPYGVYNELQTNKFAVGDTNGDDKLTSADQPPENGQIKTGRSIIYKPVDKDTLSNRQEGELVYNASDDSLYLYNGSKWVAQGGGGGGVFTLVGGLNVCPNCPDGWTEALYGYWNCLYIRGSQSGQAVGDCFCGRLSSYEATYSDDPMNRTAWLSTSQKPGIGEYRCRICVK